MVWRRAIGAVVMGFGGVTMVATIASVAVLAVSHFRSGEVFAPFGMLAAIAVGALVGGLALMVVGRLIYGQWSRAAPIANFAADVARMVGLFVAFALGATLVFLFVTGFKPEDAVAAFVLGVGTLAGVGLAYVGANIRASGRSYLD